MRRIASFLLCGFALTAGAAEVWRWKDENGVTQISDRPVPGAERVLVNPARPGAPGQPAATAPRGTAAVPAPAFEGYARCNVATPAADAVFQWNEAVPASVDLDPALQGGHQIQAFLNGSRLEDWGPQATSHSFMNLFRGSYTLSVRVVDAEGRPVCTGASITFHVRQPSLLSPVRQPPRR